MTVQQCCAVDEVQSNLHLGNHLCAIATEFHCINFKTVIVLRKDMTRLLKLIFIVILVSAGRAT